MPALRRSLLLAAAALLQAAAVLAAGKCPSIPAVSGLDQAPTSPANYGKCTSATEKQFTQAGHWCNGSTGKSFKPVPGPPQGKAAQCLKFGRATIYRGPMYGSSTAHKAACNKILHGTDKYALVAVSTKYLKSFQGGWNPSNKGACDKCMCIVSGAHAVGRGAAGQPDSQPATRPQQLGGGCPASPRAPRPCSDLRPCPRAAAPPLSAPL
jgi:hypothetical protein